MTTYKDDCVFCNANLMPSQKEILSNEHCIFFQVPQQILIGSGVLVPRLHRENVFELTEEEWNATYRLIHEVKAYLDERHQPDGYNLNWNTRGAAGQHLFHSHLHIIPRYRDEPLAGKDIRSFLDREHNLRPSLE